MYTNLLRESTHYGVSALGNVVLSGRHCVTWRAIINTTRLDEVKILFETEASLNKVTREEQLQFSSGRIELYVLGTYGYVVGSFVWLLRTCIELFKDHRR